MVAPPYFGPTLNGSSNGNGSLKLDFIFSLVLILKTCAWVIMTSPLICSSYSAVKYNCSLSGEITGNTSCLSEVETALINLGLNGTGLV